jgi:hypothetical protein
MAAVEVIEYEGSQVLDTRPYLRLVEVAAIPAPRRTGPTIAQRRAARARMMHRRRRTIVALALVAGVALLAFPGNAFGGVTGAGLSTDLANSSVLASGMNYEVKPGDSVGSIAALMNPVNPSTARDALVDQIDSTVVVPGEHIVIP